jgi:hypothetical protein
MSSIKTDTLMNSVHKTFHYTDMAVYVYFQLRIAAFKAYCAIWVIRSNFRHQASPRLSPRDRTQLRKVELWARNIREFCLNADFHVTFRDLLYTVNLHGTDGFTSPLKDGPKNLTASAGCEPATLVTKCQHATSRPPKPMDMAVYMAFISSEILCLRLCVSLQNVPETLFFWNSHIKQITSRQIGRPA